MLLLPLQLPKQQPLPATLSLNLPQLAKLLHQWAVLSQPQQQQAPHWPSLVITLQRQLPLLRLPLVWDITYLLQVPVPPFLLQPVTT